MGIVIRGDGIAACCCGQLLGSAGFAVMHEETGRTPVPALMLSRRTQRLMCDVFDKADLFDGFARVEARIVQWEKSSSPVRIPHSAVVLSEDELLGRLNFSAGHQRSADYQPSWTVFASRPLPSPIAEHHFGSRVATVLPADLADDLESAACWIESLSNGWLFLLPAPSRKGWLLAVGAAHDTLLSASRLVARQIRSLGPPAGQFPACPVIADPFCGLFDQTRWLACGSAALAFDPLCGDGTGNALREAILASAVIRAAFRGEPEAELLDHYRTRLLYAFRRHLQLCNDFYTSARQGPWWDAELELIARGLEYCERESRKASPFRYRLQGFELHGV